MELESELELDGFEAGQERYLVDLEKAAEWPARKALIHRPVPPQLKAYLGRSANLWNFF
jgi:hypothetical protein